MRSFVVALILLGLPGCLGPGGEEPQPTGTVTAQTPAVTTKQLYVVATDFSTPASEGFYKFRPQTFNAKKGETVNLTLKNAVGNRDVHNLVLQGYDLKLVGVKDMTASAEFVAAKSGSFKYYCDLMYGPNVSHRQVGFEGTLTIAES